ncbi:S9 family peptidase [Gaetbulibacter aquiaggeris]|uniref:S9 family peptidase n=1 Tax=Gaetbulibacter aquiaggeris TaxID=1735373 RepID=A0ABW7MNT7_9FLAO
MKKSILFVSIFLFVFVLQAQDTINSTWTPEHSMKFKSISEVDLSPDGKYVVYVVRTPFMEGEKSEYVSQIWVSSSDGKMDIQYTQGTSSSASPAFSPDGQHIAFMSKRSDENQIWLMRLMGGEAEQITFEKNGVNSFQWSPDGKKIAFLKTDELTEEEEKIKKEKRDVIEVDKNFKYAHIYTINIEKEKDAKRKVQRLTGGDYHVNSFDWSPDGKTIVFSHKVNPKINTDRIDANISLVASDSSALKLIVSQPGPDTNPKFSPDGQQIAFQSTGGRPEPIGMDDIYVISKDGTGLRKLMQTPDRNASINCWGTDGKSIYFTETLKTSQVLYNMPIEASKTSEIALMSNTNGVSTSYSINPRKKEMAFVFQDLNTPPELYFSELNGKNPLKLSAINSDIAMPKMGKTELIKWVSKDGMEIEGLLTYPINYKKGEKVPLALQIHGGPAGVFTQMFTGGPSIYMTQYFAQNGIAILRPNPRGSTGYGKEFRYANFKDWGFGDYEDVMSGVDKVIDMGIADENRLAVMGWSYGGYLTSFIVTKTDRFKVASMGAGLPNLISMVTTTDVQDYLVGHMGNEFWDDYEIYEKHSAIYRIKNVSTPTQIIHGANDLRVPFTQGQEFYVALDRRGIDTEMLVLPRTPHGPSEPKLLMEVSPRILKWFSRYININL